MADYRTCKICGEAKPFERSTWVWRTHNGCYGNICKACHIAKCILGKQQGLYVKVYNPASNKSRATRHAKRHPGAANAASRTWKKLNTATAKHATKAWYAKNPGYASTAARRRELTLIQRTPKWVDPEHAWFIQEAYSLMQLRTAVTGIQWHVDHVVPLHGKHVSGLHVIQNLCVIPARHNLVKGNSYE